MSLTAQHKETKFSVGDTVKVTQRITEGDKKRLQAFEGLLIGIKGSRENTSITVRRIGTGQVGIERIFPLLSPTIDKVEVVRKGGRGVRHAKLYYVRGKSKKEIEKIYSRATKKEMSKAGSANQKTKAANKSVKSVKKTTSPKKSEKSRKSVTTSKKTPTSKKRK